MTLVFRQTLEGINPSIITTLSPLVNGRRDIGQRIEQHTYPEPGNLGTGFPIQVPVSPVEMDAACIRHMPFISAPSSFGVRIAATPTSSWAAAWSQLATASPEQKLLGGDDYFFWAYDGTTRRFGLLIEGLSTAPFWPWDPPFDPTLQLRLSLVDADGFTGMSPAGSWQVPIGQTCRFEVVADSATQATVRVYLGSSLTPARTITRTVPSAVADRLHWGTISDFAPGRVASPKQMSRFHVWDTRTGPDGSHDDPGSLPAFRYIRPPWRWSEWDGTTETTPEPMTPTNATEVVNAPLGTTTPLEPLLANGSVPLSATATREIAPPAFTQATYVYGPRAGQNYILYVPTGTPPPGGWPVILTVQTDFFVNGGSATLDTNFRDRALFEGFAVASTGVNNCVAGPFTPNPSIDGIWPSMILDTKRAARHLINGGAGRDGTNPNKIITAGHSAGGYTSCAAMVTRGMTNNGFGVDMTIGGGPDPAFLGSLMLGSPVDFVTARANDPTHPNYGSSVPGTPGQGIIHATIAAIKGFSWDTPAAPLSVDGMNLHELIALAGASVVKPIRYHRGGSDLTIIAQHQTALAAACASIGAPYEYFLEPGIPHADLTREVSHHQWVPWAKNLL